MKKKVNTETKSYQNRLRRKLARKALRLWTNVVKKRAGGRCEACGLEHGTVNEKGRPLYLNAHHIEDKLNWALRFDPRNGVMLCPGCHKYNNASAHRSPVWFVDWLRKIRGDAEVRYLLARRSGAAHPQRFDCWSTHLLETVIKQLEEML